MAFARLVFLCAAFMVVIAITLGKCTANRAESHGMHCNAAGTICWSK